VSDHLKIPTSAEVYAVIFARHNSDLIPFGSFSDPTGTFHGGPGDTGRMDTEYGFKSCATPIIGISTTWPIAEDGKEGKRQSRYWLCVGTPE
jgi:hypothetical protein